MPNEVKKTKKLITIRSAVPEWMRSEVIAWRMQERVQAIVAGLAFRAAPETVQAIANAIVEGYVAGYGDGRGMLEHHAESEEDAQRLADVIVEHEAEEAEGDCLAIAAFVRRVAGIIEQRGLTTSPAPKGLPS